MEYNNLAGKTAESESSSTTKSVLFKYARKYQEGETIVPKLDTNIFGFIKESQLSVLSKMMKLYNKKKE